MGKIQRNKQDIYNEMTSQLYVNKQVLGINKPYANKQADCIKTGNM